MRGKRRWVAVGALVALAALSAAPSGAGASVTIGSSLLQEPNSGEDCSGCTYVLQSSAGAPAQDGVVSPVNGTVTGWRIRTGAFTRQITFRVVRALGGGLYTGAGTTPAVTPPLSQITPYPFTLPINKGDLIGITCGCTGGGSSFFRAGGTSLRFGSFAGSDLLPDGGVSAPNTTKLAETTLQAIIEPTSDFTAKVKAKSNGKVKLTATLPNGGTLVSSGKRIKRKETSVSASGEVSLTLKPTGSTRDKLEDGNSVKAKIKFEFTPTGGIEATEKSKLKLKD